MPLLNIHCLPLLLLSRLALAQADAPVDSLLQRFGYPADDTAAILALYDAAYEIELSDPQTALRLYRRGAAWSRSVGYANGVGKGYNYCGIVWFNLGQLDSAIACARRSLPHFQQAGNRRSYAASLNNIGNAYNIWNDYTRAISYYQRANAVYESLGEKTSIISNLNNIGNLLVRSGNFDRGEHYLQDAFDRSQAQGFIAGLADVCSNLGSLEEARGRHEPALVYFRDALRYYQELGETNFVVQSHSNLGRCYGNQGKHEEALTHLETALNMVDTLDLPRERVGIQANLCGIYTRRADWAKAEHMALAALPQAQALGDLLFEKQLVQALAQSYEGQNKPSLALAQYHRLENLNQRLFDSEKNRQLLDLERRYESEKKERRILQQQLQLQRKNAQNRITLLLAALITLVAGLAILWLRNRMKFNQRLAAQRAELQTQRLRDLEREQKLLALDAMFQGQEAERHRIARDLHDGLGGLLASVKMHVTALLREAGIPESRPITRQTQRLLDEASTEVRRIAHNMMPGALLHDGLLPAIEEIAEGLRRGQGMDVLVQAIGIPRRLPETQEVMLFRIVQELVQNAVRHARASRIIIQLQRHDGELNLLVEDNGRGFNAGEAPPGLGLKSIVSRVQYLQGVFDIDSVPGEGTTVVVNVPVPGLDAEVAAQSP